MIALESGVVDGIEFALQWNPVTVPAEPWWPEVWAQDQTLNQAFSRGAIWFYQEIARRIGQEHIESDLARLQYGNGDLSAGVDRFWLEGGFGISAEEQVHFLRRLVGGDFQLLDETVRAVKTMALIEDEPDHHLSGKTGWVGFGNPSAPQLGWFVGYLEASESTYFFSINLDMRSSEDARRRIAITRDILRSLDLF